MEREMKQASSLHMMIVSLILFFLPLSRYWMMFVNGWDILKHFTPIFTKLNPSLAQGQRSQTPTIVCKRLFYAFCCGWYPTPTHMKKKASPLYIISLCVVSIDFFLPIFLASKETEISLLIQCFVCRCGFLLLIQFLFGKS